MLCSENIAKKIDMVLPHENLVLQQVLMRMWRKRNPLALLLEMQTGAATVENSMEGPQKIKNRTSTTRVI